MISGIKKCLRTASITALICTLIILLSMVPAVNTMVKSEESAAYNESGEPISGTEEFNAYSTPEERLGAMTLKFQSQGYSLYFDSVNGDVAYRCEETGETYFSSPINIKADSSSDTVKQKLASSVRIEYTKIGASEGELLSWSDSVKEAQIEYIGLENGFRLKYVLGREEQRRLLPPAIPAKSMEELILPSLESRNAGKIKLYYKKYDPETTDKAQLDLIRPLYPLVDEMPIYVLKSVTSREGEILEEIIAKTDYNLEKMELDIAELGAKQQESAIPFFKFYVDFVLEGKELVVTLDSQKMTYDNKNVVLRNIAIMEYFMSNQNGEGYFLVPDGSGAVVPFQKAGLPAGRINIPIYSYDTGKTFAVSQEYQKTAPLPVFGMKTESTSLFAEVEEGAESTEISVNTRAGADKIAWASPILKYTDSEKFGFSESTAAKQSTWEAYDKSSYNKSFKVRYAMLGENGDYSRMASYYRERLISRGILKENSGGLSFNMSVIGTVKREERFLIFPTIKNIPLTTFDDTKQMAEALIDGGVEKINIKYTGWANGGVENSIFTSATPHSVIGGKKGLSALSEFAKVNEIGLYPDADLLYVTQDKMFDGFSPATGAARMLNKQYSGKYAADLAVNLVDLSSFRYTLGIKTLNNTYEKFIKSYTKQSMTGLSLGSVSSSLNSDKSKVDGRRSDYLEAQTEILKKTSESYQVMTEGGNLYSLAHSSRAVDFPLTSSGYNQSAFGVPFAAMVVHGSLSYSGSPINLSGNMQTAFLNAAENGAGLFFEFTMQNSKKLKTTALSHYYATDFSTWKETAIQYWKKLSLLLGGLENEPIIAHEVIEDGVTVTTYKTGASIYVNYTENDVEVDGTVIGKMDAVRLERH